MKTRLTVVAMGMAKREKRYKILLRGRINRMWGTNTKDEGEREVNDDRVSQKRK